MYIVYNIKIAKNGKICHMESGHPERPPSPKGQHGHILRDVFEDLYVFFCDSLN